MTLKNTEIWRNCPSHYTKRSGERIRRGRPCISWQRWKARRLTSSSRLLHSHSAQERVWKRGSVHLRGLVAWLLPGSLPRAPAYGEFRMDLGGAYKKGRPVRSLYNYQVLIRLCSELNFHLAEEFFWYNPAKFPSPIEWVNKRKIRAKDAVNTVWWLSKSDYPKAEFAAFLCLTRTGCGNSLRTPSASIPPRSAPRATTSVAILRIQRWSDPF